jgi:hypothetical protein
MEFLILIIAILITISNLSKHTKNKTGNQIMLLGIEITVVGVGCIAFGNFISSNEGFICALIGILIVSIGVTVSIFGFLKN